MKEKLKRFDSFADVVNAASEEFNLTIKEACQILRCSRNWFCDYVRPNIEYIYLSNGSSGGPDYARIVANILGEDNARTRKESVYLNARQFFTFVYDRIRCERQSKWVHISALIESQKLQTYYQKKLWLIVAIENGEYSEAKFHTEMKRLNELYIPHYALLEPVSKYKRSQAKFVQVEKEKIFLKQFMTVGDWMDYGDVPETVYREIFEKGMLKVTLSIEHEGETTQKVYYEPDPEMITPVEPQMKDMVSILEKVPEERRDSVERLFQMSNSFIVSYESWEKYQQACEP